MAAGSPTLRLQRALTLLSPIASEAIRRHYVDEVSYDDMEVTTGTSAAVWKMRAARGVARLRDLLLDDGA